MAAACDLLEAELALDRIDAELAVELPGHMRAYAAAFARGAAEPPAPSVLRRPATLRAIESARAHPLLADRVHAIARLAWPLAIEDDPRVVAARSGPRTWDGLAALTAARDAAARDRFGVGCIALLHALFGVTPAPPREVPWPAPLPGWLDPAPPRTSGSLAGSPRASSSLAGSPLASSSLAGSPLASQPLDVPPVPPPPAGVELVPGPRARTFVVEPGRHVIVVAPPITSPATAFVRLHEYGHAHVGLLAPLGVPRVIDEAAAAYVARSLAHPLEAAARARRLQLAIALDAIERGASRAWPTANPPWALWHDPGAQAAYIEAEAIADRWGSIELAAALKAERGRIALPALPALPTLPALPALP